MRPELERLLRIERQLRGPASADWPLQLLLDPELAADAEAQRQLYHGLHLAGQRMLRDELRVIHQQLYGGPGGWTRALVGGLRTLLSRRFGRQRPR